MTDDDDPTDVPDAADALDAAEAADLDAREHTRDAPVVPLPGTGEPARLLGGDRNSTKARVYLVRRGDREFVVKSSEGCGWFARWLLRRESKAISRMPRLRCLPVVLETKPDRVVTEWVGGRDLFDFRRRGLTEPRCAALEEAIAELHAAGFAHGDLGRHDIVFRDDGTVALLDFATAIGPGCPPLLWRILLPLWKRTDRARVARITSRYRKVREDRREMRRLAQSDRH